MPQSDSSKAHPILYALAAIGFSGVCTLAVFCAKVGAAQNQLETAIATQSKQGDVLSQVVKYEAIDRYQIQDQSARLTRLEGNK